MRSILVLGWANLSDSANNLKESIILGIIQFVANCVGLFSYANLNCFKFILLFHLNLAVSQECPSPLDWTQIATNCFHLQFNSINHI